MVYNNFYEYQTVRYALREVVVVGRSVEVEAERKLWTRWDSERDAWM